MDKSYFVNSKFVKELSGKDFDQTSTWKLKDKGCSIVMFYADWCPHCSALKDTWEKLARSALFMNVCALNCNVEPFCQKIKEDKPDLISGYPTIIFYKGGKPVGKFEDKRDVQTLLKRCMDVCCSDGRCKR